MFKSVLLLFVFISANASTIATVSCNGNVVSDPSEASCRDATSAAGAKALVGALNSLFLVEVYAGGPGQSSAEADIQGTYLFTVTTPPSSGGGGYFLPCFSRSQPGIGVAQSATFGPFILGQDWCPGLGQPKPASAFHFDDGSMLFTVTLSAVAPQHAAPGWAVLESFQFWDKKGYWTGANYSLTFVSDQLLPEPNSFAILGLTLLALLVAYRRRRVAE